MSSLTEKLRLFKYDTKTDGKKTFNIDEALNQNWDKIDAGFNQLRYPVFCFNSGLIDEQGQSALCSLENDILTQHAPCVCTTSDGQTFIVNEDVTLDISELSDGDYNVFYYPETREMKAYANTVYIQDYQPSAWVENDIWVDTSVMPYITKQNISGVVQTIKCVSNAHLARVSGGVALMLANYNNSQILTDWQNGIEKSIGTLTDTKANITDLDGKWHGTGIQIAQNQTISATSNYIYDLSNWLPNDGNNYEILLDCHAFISKNQVGKVISIVPSSLLQDNFYLCGVYSNNNNYQNDTYGSCYCPIGANRKLNITGKHSTGEGLFNLYGRGYRKIR